MAAPTGGLFGAALPEGLEYRPGFLTIEEEALLCRDIEGVAFSTFEMRGVAARRRVAFFGRSYDADAAAVPPIPPFLDPFRERAAAWARVDADAFVMALINEYPPGAPIGWHRDAPQYGHRRGPVSAVAVPHEVPALRAPRRAGRRTAPAEGHARDYPRAALRLPDRGTGEDVVRASHSGRAGTPVFGDFPHAPPPPRGGSTGRRLMDC